MLLTASKANFTRSSVILFEKKKKKKLFALYNCGKKQYVMNTKMTRFHYKTPS